MRIGSLPGKVLRAAEGVLRSRRNILVSGGTGSGKTTLLNALIELLPEEGRIVAIEDTLELRIERANCLRFEAGAVGTETPVSIRDLVRHALRHRPDHIVVGEVRGGEAADLLQALNTGHGGSLTTVHANNARSALSRLASCAMQAGAALPLGGHLPGRRGDGISLVLHMSRRGGKRFIEEATHMALCVQGKETSAHLVPVLSRSSAALAEIPNLADEPARILGNRRAFVHQRERPTLSRAAPIHGASPIGSMIPASARDRPHVPRLGSFNVARDPGNT